MCGTQTHPLLDNTILTLLNFRLRHFWPAHPSFIRGVLAIANVVTDNCHFFYYTQQQTCDGEVANAGDSLLRGYVKG